MKHHYSAYGLGIASTRPLPGLAPGGGRRQIDVEIELGARISGLVDPESLRLRFRSRNLAENGLPLLTVRQGPGGALYHWQYHDGTEFLIDRAGAKIVVDWSRGESFETAATYLYGPVLGFVLRLRGIFSLHASAVAVGDRALALVGHAGAGKSTTAAAFARLGYPVLSDDVVALEPGNGELLAIPSYPRIQLWPTSVGMLFGSERALPRLILETRAWTEWDKRYLDLDGDAFRYESRPLPLAAVYLLEERSDNPQAPFVSEVSPREALISLVGHNYTVSLSNRELEAEEFESLALLVERVPVRRVVPSADPSRLEELCRVVLNDHLARSAEAA